ncbi:esterase [Bacillus pumilus]|uniref:Esterase n=1 Tax=Bacillus pumilus TaxID=1408 RepID=A0A2A5INE7_BACPU|nr:alpha/beta hydrolase-fold protein [Bacillus pumilus]PCK18579.1 esterase [Bacillus pumilus]
MNGTFLYDELNGRQLDIYLPQDTSIDVPAVFVQDGSSLFRTQLLQIERMIEANIISPIIIVGIHPFNRLDEYTPWKAPSLRSHFPDFKGEAQTYLSFLANDLLPYIQKQYPVKQTCNEHSHIGASLGGLFAIYTLLMRPTLFKNIATISGSFWYQNFLPYAKQQCIQFVDHLVYLSVGSEEGKGKTSAQRHMPLFTKQLHDLLSQKGMQKWQLQYHIEQGEGHHLRQFQRNFLSAIKWFYKRDI